MSIIFLSSVTYMILLPDSVYYFNTNTVRLITSLANIRFLTKLRWYYHWLPLYLPLPHLSKGTLKLLLLLMPLNILNNIFIWFWPPSFTTMVVWSYDLLHLQLPPLTSIPTQISYHLLLIHCYCCCLRFFHGLGLGFLEWLGLFTPYPGITVRGIGTSAPP